jgi:hypothetical protein
MSNPVTVAVRRLFGDSEVNFTTEARDLQAALAAAHELAGVPTAASVGPAPTTEAKPEKTKATAGTKAEAKKPTADSASSAPGATQATTAPKADAPAQTSSTPDVQPSGDEVTYDGNVKPAILQIAKDKGRDMVTALMQRYGATKGPELKAEQYADFVKDAQRVLAGEYDPTVAEEEALA